MLRKILAFFLAWAFSLFLLILVFSAALSNTFTLSNFKSWLSKHAIYSHIIDSVLTENKDTEIGSGADDISLSNTVVKKTFKKTFTPKLLQNITEQFLDGTEPWLQGKTPKPTFRIDLSKVKSKLAKNLGIVLKKRYSNLPVCSAGQTPNFNEPLTVNCRVDGVNIDQQIQKVVSTIKNSKEFLPKTILTANNLKIKLGNSSKAEPLFDQLKDAPLVYRFIHLSPYIFGLLSLASGALLVFASKALRRGLRRVAVPLVSSGLFLLGGALITNSALNREMSKLFLDNKIAGADLRNSILPFIKEISDSLTRTVIIFSVLFLAVGLGIIIYLIVTRKPKTAKPKTK